MTATALTVDPRTSTGLRRSPAPWWRPYFSEARYEIMRVLRQPGFAIPMLALPAGLYLLFGVLIFGSVTRIDIHVSNFILTAFSVIGVMGPGMFGFGIFVAQERDQGLLTLKRALPAPPSAYLLAKMLMSTDMALLVMVTMVAAGLAFGRLHLSPARCLLFVAVNVLGSLPFCSLGLLIGTLASGKSAPAFVNLLYQLMMHLSGLLYPLPKFLMNAAAIWPTHHLQQLAMSAMGSPSSGSTAVHIAVLSGITVVVGALAVRRLARAG
ncbi:MAG: ABC transporter permease [Acidobacteriia bacterium]|nr:ABC transporter permease [Terriglobia bacterium]